MNVCILVFRSIVAFIRSSFAKSAKENAKKWHGFSENVTMRKRCPTDDEEQHGLHVTIRSSGNIFNLIQLKHCARTQWNAHEGHIEHLDKQLNGAWLAMAVFHTFTLWFHLIFTYCSLPNTPIHYGCDARMEYFELKLANYSLFFWGYCR